MDSVCRADYAQSPSTALRVLISLAKKPSRMTSWSGVGIASSKHKISILAYFSPSNALQRPHFGALSRHHPEWKTRPAHLGSRSSYIVWTLRLATPKASQLSAKFQVVLNPSQGNIGLGPAFEPVRESLTHRPGETERQYDAITVVAAAGLEIEGVAPDDRRRP